MEICSRCGEEVRWGWRPGTTSPAPPAGFWMHRDPSVDHMPIFGQRVTAEDFEEIEQQRHLTRYTEDDEPYTTAEYDFRRMSKRKRDQLEADAPDDDEEGHDDIEPVEVRTINLPNKGRVFIGCSDGTVAVAQVPGGVRTILNLAAKIGWEVERLTYARGPYLGANGKSLGVSDSVVLLVRGPIVDGTPLLGVASWRDAKSDWAWRVHNKTTTSVGAKALIAWMKENPCVHAESA